jgi:MYXO-CTERM domain-containing protein
LCLWAAAGAALAAPLPAPHVDATTPGSAAEWIAPVTESPRWSAMPEFSDVLLPLPLSATVRPAPLAHPAVEKLGWTAAAPDPGLYALVGLGLLSLALLARRRRR